MKKIKIKLKLICGLERRNTLISRRIISFRHYIRYIFHTIHIGEKNQPCDGDKVSKIKNFSMYKTRTIIYIIFILHSMSHAQAVHML